MTIEEAIKDINECIKPIVGGISLDMAVSALEKQIPKKPIEEWHESPFPEDVGCLFQAFICPSCRKMQVMPHIDAYCSMCGQKIDWSADNRGRSNSTF